jgi:putative ATPase
VSELFTTDGALPHEGPLADRMRPQTLDDVLGQDHIVGPGRLLRRAIQADRLSSVIFYGPPGTGKTSLARVIANTTRSSFETLNAVLCGIKDIREAIDRSDERRRLYGKRTILFVDEVHRWNKAQQDALLPWVENGVVILVGATTENPFFEVNRALVSRSRIFQLKPLSAADLRKAVERTIADRERGYGKWKVRMEETALEHLVKVAGGDARSLLNALELAVETSCAWPPPDGEEIFISLESAEESIQRRALLYDRDGDYHFDTISAFIKSVRGSDPDAALYWLAKMVRAGEDPSFIFRRMIILAGEDVGLADPQAISVVISCAEAFDRIGFPEGNFPLAEACLYLATAPKSNSAMAFFDALKEVELEDADVPRHLQDASRDGDSLGHGQGYIYPHAYRDHWAAQQYLPDALKGKTFYTPSRLGYEGKIREEVLKKREIQTAAILGDLKPEDGDLFQGSTADEILTWSSSSKGREGWFKRLESGRSRLLLADRDRIIAAAGIARHDRILLPAADTGLLLWESLRKAPEGLSAALVQTEEARLALARYASTLEEDEQPVIAVFPNSIIPDPTAAERFFSCAQFDHILAISPFRRVRRDPSELFGEFAAAGRLLLAYGANVVIMENPPLLGERISRILREECGAENTQAPLADKLKEAEDLFFTDRNQGLPWTWDRDTLESAFRDAGFSTTLAVLDQSEERLLTLRDTSLWFDRQKSSWGAFIARNVGDGDFNTIKEVLLQRIKQGPLVWKWKSLFLKAQI